MNVHLIRSSELSVETFANVLNLLKSFRGPIEYHSGESEATLNELLTRTWETEKDFQRKMPFPQFSISEKRSFFSFPREENYQNWQYFFEKCYEAREDWFIPSTDHVFLLTDLANERNWFGAMGPSGRDYFIHTADWGHYFGSQVDIRFPIAYEISMWIVRHLMFSDTENYVQHVHQDTRGCGNDFCRNKKDIILKMRTADLCSDCMEIVEKRKISPLLLSQLFDTMDGIRNNLSFRERGKVIQQPSKLELRGYQQRIFFTDFGDLELRLNPKEKTIYLFYLRHPEGVPLVLLQDYRDEIGMLYRRYTNQSEPSEIAQSIDRMLDPRDNDINVILSRIKKKLKNTVGESLLPYYQIEGEHGGAKRITLDREFVKWVE